MNTFLPFQDFSKSAEVLDNLRLRKQYIEAISILNTLSGKSEAWKNHPSVRMWDKSESALAYYTNYIAAECRKRGFKAECLLLDLDSIDYPKWINNERVYHSHRANLLRKGRADAVCLAIKKHLKISSINNWLTIMSLPIKPLLKKNHILQLEIYTENENIKIGPNFYSGKFLEEEKLDYLSVPYFWPKNE